MRPHAAASRAGVQVELDRHLRLVFSDMSAFNRSFTSARALRSRSAKSFSFSADWLTLREPYDRAARNADVLEAVARHFAGDSSIAIVDLACGTGSTLRTVGPRLPSRQAC